MTFCVSAAKRPTVQSEPRSDIQLVGVFFLPVSVSVPAQNPALNIQRALMRQMHLFLWQHAFVKYAQRPGVPGVTDTDEHLLDLGADVSAWRSHPAGLDGRR